MRLKKLALLAAICCGTSAPLILDTAAWGQTAITDDHYQFAEESYPIDPSMPACGCGEVTCGCELPMPSCDHGCAGDCDGGCQLGSGGLFDKLDGHRLADMGSLVDGSCFQGDCNLGDPYSLMGQCGAYKMGGWFQLGYHSANTILFNSRKHEYQLHQAWVYAEKAIDTSNGFDLGGRIDYVYGTDGPDTQAFGINNDHWDNGWDNGRDYGHALPQVYFEAGYGDWKAKVGHFFTIIGYEVVAAPDNFFYSHAYTMYNSEPFTHTGALLTYSMNQDVEVFGGYVLGWDSGFEDNGDAFLGGSSVALTDDISVTSTLIAGRFADNAGGDERGVMTSSVASVQLTENLKYILQSDYLDTENVSGATVRETFGINQYLIRTLSDCVSVGGRFEWWNVEADSQGFYGDNAAPGLAAIAGGDYDIFALTLGVNYKPHANVMVRPEIRWDWVDGNRDNLALADLQILENNDDRQTTFGVDTIFLY